MDPAEKPEKRGTAQNPQAGSSDFTAWWNGNYQQLSQLNISIFDAGFVQGTTVVEQLRTFSGKPFKVDQHVQRLMRSLEISSIPVAQSAKDFSEIIHGVAEKNFPLVDDGDDLSIGLWVTPGLSRKYANAKFLDGDPFPSVCCYAHPLDFYNWHDIHSQGQRLITASIPQLASWPSELKCRSRMHYHLADTEARSKDPAASALLLDSDGFVNETSRANIVAFIDGEGLVSPRKDKILPGVSLSVMEELAEQVGEKMIYRDMMPFELVTAKEVMLCSTAACVWPVVKIDENQIADGEPGPMFKKLLKEWQHLVGVDIEAQAVEFAER